MRLNAPFLAPHGGDLIDLYHVGTGNLPGSGGGNLLPAGQEKCARLPANFRSPSNAACVTPALPSSGARIPTRASREIVGKHYRPACGRCEAMPWERCGCSVFPGLPVRIASRHFSDTADG